MSVIACAFRSNRSQFVFKCVWPFRFFLDGYSIFSHQVSSKVFYLIVNCVFNFCWIYLPSICSVLLWMSETNFDEYSNIVSVWNDSNRSERSSTVNILRVNTDPKCQWNTKERKNMSCFQKFFKISKSFDLPGFDSVPGVITNVNFHRKKNFEKKNRSILIRI